MICSIATPLKSENMISTTGRVPVAAAPVAAPTKPASLMGVSRTRSSPNSSQRSPVTSRTPPKRPMSSPIR